MEENFSFGALKLLANHEEQLFTFFGFLPPYFVVSGFPAYLKGQILTRSIDWYQKFFISCLVARYWKINRKSIENLSKIRHPPPWIDGVGQVLSLNHPPHIAQGGCSSCLRQWFPWTRAFRKSNQPPPLGSWRFFVLFFISVFAIIFPFLI